MGSEQDEPIEDIDIGPEPQLWQTIEGVDVWRFGLDTDEGQAHRLRVLLCADEQRRADRYVTAKLQIHFTVARASLRRVLSQYIGIEPAAISFAYGPNGKPYIQYPVQFNLAHSGGLALMAVSRSKDAAVGVDLEQIDARVEIEAIASRFFTSEECRDMMALPGDKMQERFFTLWCCKEAYLKAIGSGISSGLDTCRVLWDKDQPFGIFNPDESESSTRWRIHRLFPRAGFAGALCEQK